MQLKIQPLPGSARRSRLLTLFLALTLSLFGATLAHASHFRGASITWKRVGGATSRTVEVTVTESWRSGLIGNNTYNWGDGTGSFSTSGATTIATGTNATGDFTIVRRIIQHTYGGDGPYTISASSGARIGTLTNSANSNWSLAAVVDLRNGNQGSPVISTPIVVQMIRGVTNSVQLSYSDVDGDPVRFRMATTTESSITSTPAGLTVSNTGLLSWNTTGTSVGQLYAVQVLAFDNHPLTATTAGGTRVFFDFIIQIIEGNPPVATGPNGPFSLAINQPFSTTVVGTDTDGGNLTVTHQGLPAGATLTPASGTTGTQPLSATFAWTPTLADAGSSFGVTIVFTDPTGLQAAKSFSLTVHENQPPVANAGPDTTVNDLTSAGAATVVTLNGTASNDPENAPITYAWTQTDGPAVTLTGANTATPSFTAPLVGNGAPAALTFQLSVSDGKSTRSDSVVVLVKHVNRAPVAIAAAPANANEGTTIILDGSASSDVDGDPLTYTWTQLSGTPVIISSNGSNSPQANFVHLIPGLHSIAGESLQFSLTVSDGIASSTSAPVTVFVRNVNAAPVADAGHTHTFADTDTGIELHGHATDSDGDPLTFSWTQIAGPIVALGNANASHTTFDAPAVSPAQGSVTLTFRLVVSDAIGANDAAALTDSTTVDILIRHANRAPVADAGADKIVPEGSIITLDGTGSYDPDNDPIATYAWVQTAGTPVTLSNAGTATPSFAAPNVGPDGAVLTFALTVTDNPNSAFLGSALTSAADTITVNVKYVNQPPVVSATSPGAKDEGTVVALSATASDPDGNPLAYAWQQVSGPTVTLVNPNSAAPSFVAPLVPFGGGSVSFKVTVADGFGGEASASCTVEIRNVNNAPVADAGINKSTTEGSSVTLSGALSSDLDGEALTYAWTQTAGPTVALAGAQSVTPTFTAPLLNVGGDPNASVTLTFTLTVTDIAGASATDTVDVKVANVDRAPIADAGGNKNAGEATTVTLSAAASSDPDGDALTYLWTQTAGPAVTLSGANSAAPSFTAPFVGSGGAALQFKLVVTDPYGLTGTDTAAVSVFNTNTPPNVSQAKASTESLWPPNHAMVPISILGVIDPENNATITITKVTQDEPTNGLGDGDTAIDAIIQGSTVLIRSERDGKGNGRVYHIHFKASDFEGSATGMVKVSVPKDKRGDTAIDGGELYDSTR